MGILLSTPNRLAKISACGFFYLFNKYISTVRLTANSRLWPKTVGYLQIATRKAVLVRQAEHMLFCVFYHYFDIITTFVYWYIVHRPMSSHAFFRSWTNFLWTGYVATGVNESRPPAANMVDGG